MLFIFAACTSKAIVALQTFPKKAPVLALCPIACSYFPILCILFLGANFFTFCFFPSSLPSLPSLLSFALSCVIFFLSSLVLI